MERLLAEIVEKAQSVLGGDLISIVLFGSRARGTARLLSDMDLLVIAENLPDEPERSDLTLEIEDLGFDYGIPIQVILATPEEARLSTETGAPLMFEIRDAHRILYDKDDFFRSLLSRFDELLKQWKVRKLKERVWEVPGLAVSRLSRL